MVRSISNTQRIILLGLTFGICRAAATKIHPSSKTKTRDEFKGIHNMDPSPTN